MHSYSWTAPQSTGESGGDLKVYRGVGAAAAVLQTASATIIAIPGSSPEPHDWVANFSARQINAPALGRVHAGFWNYADALWRNFLRSRAADFSDPLYICGHSQGGAVAAVVGHYLAHAQRPPWLIATFGSPRFLHSADARRYRLPLLNFRNAGDPVPLLPCSWRQSWAAPGIPVRLAEDGCVTRDQPGFATALHYGFRRLLAAVGWGDTAGMRKSHGIAEYVARLQGEPSCVSAGL